MEEAEYRVEEEKILSGVPEELRGAIACLAWEHGHSYGYHEVILHLQELVSSLREPIRLYGERCRSEGKQ